MADQYDPYQYLLTFDGDAAGFLAGKKRGERIGQAFFNSVNENDKWILRQSPSHDCYYKDTVADVKKTIQYLLNYGS